MIPIIRLIRPHQWVKNLFILIPIFFAGEITNQQFFIPLVLGFLAFSFVSSSIYVINDLRDIEMDKLHPKKKFRPLASGQVSKPVAFVVLLLFGVAGFVIGGWLSFNYLYILLIYFGLNLAYSMGLKQISILDLLIVSSGFVLRTVAGGVITNIEMSHWLLIMIFLLSLFLAIAKRRDDVLMMLDSGVSVRKSIKNYNLHFIDSALTMLSAIIVIAYIMYTISPEAEKHIHFEHLYGTAIFVVTGILRYLQITLVENNSGSPVSILYKDPFIQVTVGAWIASFFLILYL